VVAVDHVNFQVEGGKVFGFLGSNGAGKTTSIRVLTTLFKHAKGVSAVEGLDVVTEVAKVRELIAIPLELTFDNELTGGEKIELLDRPYEFSDNVAEDGIEELLNLVGISDAADLCWQHGQGVVFTSIEVPDLIFSFSVFDALLFALLGSRAPTGSLTDRSRFSSSVP